MLRIYRWFSWLLLAVSLHVSGVAAEVVKLTLGYENRTVYPYMTGAGPDVPPENPGASVELMQILDESIDEIEIEFVRYTWKACLAEMRRGKLDGIFNASYKPERRDYGRYPWAAGDVDSSRRLTTRTYRFYSPEDKPLDWDGSKINAPDYTVIAPKGYSVVNDLKLIGIEAREVETTTTALRLLIEGRADAAALLEESAEYLIDADPRFRSIEAHALPIKTKPYYLMLSHQFVDMHPDLALKIWARLAELRVTSLPALISKYQGE